MTAISIKTALLSALMISPLMALDFSLVDAAPENSERGRRSAESKGKPDGSGRMRDRFKAFQEADLDGDKALTMDEFSKMTRIAKMEEEKRRKLFDFLDKNKDGKVHMRELQPREPGWMMGLNKEFGQLDTNKDRTLDRAEFGASSHFSDFDPAMIDKLFKRLDRNKNKRIERPELKSVNGQRPRPHFDFKKYDINSSGGLDIEEYSKIPWMDKWPEDRRNALFQRIDSNNDGEVSASEIRAAHHMHKPGPPKRGEKGRRDKSKESPKPGGKPRRKGHDERPDVFTS